MTKKFSLITISIIFLFCSLLFAQKIKVTNAVIYKVVDGDTVWVMTDTGKRVKLRLLGIDTPEKYYSRKLIRDARTCGVQERKMEYLGKQASRHAKLYLKKGQKVKVVVYGKGFYGRKLAIIYLPDGQNFNELMVKDGFACIYKYRGHKSKELPQDEWEKLNSLLNKAKSERRGLWKEYYNVMNCLCY